ncbi:hypothetical protein N7532_008523 [Penicillium argentinense]|uniref:Uncharacterized protein n=1 Tax=Penicillium argentinense TaxID=1131581 RepID=A0A9W9EXK6_9EURO|nr:uncharacterized protein N7532_008523 [Penicillium argentinense]KAJ5089839.1 hypothetical protein N7532_008523 [Penicillium argentinense]
MTTTGALPLTTTFVPPTGCTTDIYRILWLTSSDYPWWWLSLGLFGWSTCFPQGTSLQATSRLVCSPESYTAAAPSTSQEARLRQHAIPVHSYTYSSSVLSETGTYGVNAKSISIRWKSEDFASKVATSTTATSTTTSPTPHDH